MKGFIEVHGKADKSYLINANAIEYIAPVGPCTAIRTRCGEVYGVSEDYETVKALILEALTPTFTVMKEIENAED